MVEGFCKQDTLIVSIGRASFPSHIIPRRVGIRFTEFADFADASDEVILGWIEEVEIDRVIFYSYEKYSSFKNECEYISGRLGEEKCIFMFSED